MAGSCTHTPPAEAAWPGMAGDAGRDGGSAEGWWAAQLAPLPPRPRTVRLPAGEWQADGAALPSQHASAGGVWVQLPAIAGVAARPLRRGGPGPAAVPQAAVWVEGSRAGNGLLELELGPAGLEQLRDAQGRP
ncbi:MAG: alpha-mannosidase, partial [Cyanobium sp.]